MSRPGVAQIQQYLLGKLSPEDASSIEAFLSGDGESLSLLDTAQDKDSFVELLRVRQAQVEEADRESISSLIDKLLHMPGLTYAPGVTSAPVEATMTMTGSSGDSSLNTSEVFDFLAPPSGPGELGRLGTYRVLSVLGSGGMGVVFQAEDSTLKRQVALKVMRKEMANKPQSRDRFFREARTTAALTHDHVVTIHQVGEESGVPFLAMQLLRGESLDDRLKNGKPVELREAVRMCREAALGLAAAHEAGLIHRDIKPSNLWLDATANHRVKVLDFGLARIANPEEVNLTQAGTIVGTPAYMAPEQARGEAVDHRCDLYSLGCVLYRLTTGQPPFPGNDSIAVLLAAAIEEAVPPEELNPAIPASLAQLIRRLLKKNPAERPGSAKEVAESLEEIDRDLRQREEVPRPPVATPGARPRRRVALAAAIVLLALVPLGWFFGGTVLRFATNKGELIVEIGGEGIEVSVKQGDLVVEDRTAKRTFNLKAAAGEIEVYEKDGVGPLLTKKFTLNRGGKSTVTVTLKELADLRGKKPAPEPRGPPIQLLAHSDFDQFKREAIPADALKPFDGILARAPAELVAVIGTRDAAKAIDLLKVSPDGRRLYTMYDDQTLRAWETATGKEVPELRRAYGGGRLVRGVMVPSRDGKRLVWGGGSGGDKGITITETATGRDSLTLARGEVGSALALAMSPDGTRVAGLSTGRGNVPKVKVWDATSGQEVLSLTTETDDASARGEKAKVIDYSPDGKQLAALFGGGKVKIWDAIKGKELLTISTGSVHNYDLAFSPAGTRLAVIHSGGSLKIYDPTSGTEVVNVRDSNTDGTRLVYSPDGKWLARGSYKSHHVAVWDAATLKKLKQWKLPVQAPTVAFSPEGRHLLTGNDDGTIYILRLDQSK